MPSENLSGQSTVGRAAPVVTAFVAGFAVMSLELLGSRLVAPALGTSVLIWTNLIGVILVALALGAWAGGVLADRTPRLRLVGLLLIGAGAWSLGLAAFSRPLLLRMMALPPGLSAPVAALVLLAPPAFMLGAVPPAVLRLAVLDVARAGHTAGRLSAVGTLGSLLGTYATGYVFLPRMSVTALLLALGATLVAFGALATLRALGRTGAALLVVALGLGAYGVTQVPRDGGPFRRVHFPSAYASVVVDDVPRGRGIRRLRINRGTHSIAWVDAPGDTPGTYVRALRASTAVMPDPARVLVLGGGAFHVARDALARYPRAQLDVVEIDPAVVQAARTSFGLRDDPRMRIIVDDARPALARLTPGSYDLILHDAYSGDDAMPWHLMTREACQAYARLLTPRGVWIANTTFSPRALSPASQRFAANFFATLRSGFRWTFAVMTLDEPKEDNGLDNALTFAGNAAEPAHAAVVGAIRTQLESDASFELATPPPGRVWTDDAGFGDYEAFEVARLEEYHPPRIPPF